MEYSVMFLTLYCRHFIFPCEINVNAIMIPHTANINHLWYKQEWIYLLTLFCIHIQAKV